MPNSTCRFIHVSSRIAAPTERPEVELPLHNVFAAIGLRPNRNYWDQNSCDCSSLPPPPWRPRILGTGILTSLPGRQVSLRHAALYSYGLGLPLPLYCDCVASSAALTPSHISPPHTLPSQASLTTM